MLQLKSAISELVQTNFIKIKFQYRSENDVDIMRRETWYYLLFFIFLIILKWFTVKQLAIWHSCTYKYNV